MGKIEFDCIESLAEWSLHATKMGLAFNAKMFGDVWIVRITGY